MELDADLRFHAWAMMADAVQISGLRGRPPLPRETRLATFRRAVRDRMMTPDSGSGAAWAAAERSVPRDSSAAPRDHRIGPSHGGDIDRSRRRSGVGAWTPSRPPQPGRR